MDKKLQKEIDELRKRLLKKPCAMAARPAATEPLWFAPGPAVMPEDLPPEEVARIKKEVREAKEDLASMAE